MRREKMQFYVPTLALRLLHVSNLTVIARRVLESIIYTHSPDTKLTPLGKMKNESTLQKIIPTPSL
jgi:hypothetical protein